MDALKPPETVPIDHLLANNDPPQNRSKLQRLLQELEEKQAALDALFNELSIRRAEYVSYAEGLSQVLAPCRMVPDDIWSTVFRFIPECCWEISWVCQRWRDVALSTPSLWTEIPKIGDGKQSPEGFLSQLRARSSRSGTLPLTITALHLPLGLGLKTDDLEEFVTLVSEMVPRVESLDVYFGDQWASPTFAFLTMIPQHFDQLTRVYLHMRKDRQRDAGAVFKDTKLFQFSPKLTEMTISLTMATSITSWLSVPWGNLVNLDIGWVRLRDFYFVLESSPTLERLLALVSDKTLGVDQDQPPVHRQPIRHPHLRELVCIFHKNLDYLDALSLVDVPKIESMVFESRVGDWDYESYLESPVAFPTRTFLHLTHLYVGPSQVRYYTSALMVDFLRLARSIERLWLVWDKHMDRLFDELSTKGEGGQFPLPSLALLHIVKTPAFFFKEPKRGDWHVAINRLARKRYFVGKDDDGRALCGSLLIALSSEKSERSEELRLRTQTGLQLRLNQSMGKISDEGTNITNDDDIEPEEHYFEHLRKLIKEMQAQSTSVDDLDFLANRIEKRSKLLEVARKLANEQGAMEKCAAMILPTLEDVSETPSEFADLRTYLRYGETELITKTLLEKWNDCRTRYSDSPGWNAFFGESTEGAGEESRVCTLYYDSKSGTSQEMPRELLYALLYRSWGIYISCGGDVTYG